MKKGDPCNISPLGYYMEPYPYGLLSGCLWCEHVRKCQAKYIERYKRKKRRKEREGQK